MKTIDFRTALNYSKNSNFACISSFKNTKTFGEKGGHFAFCNILLEWNNGRFQSFQISKETFKSLKKEGIKVNINEQLL